MRFVEFNTPEQIATNTVAILLTITALIALWRNRRRGSDVTGWRWALLLAFSLYVNGFYVPLGALVVLPLAIIDPAPVGAHRSSRFLLIESRARQRVPEGRVTLLANV